MASDVLEKLHDVIVAGKRADSPALVTQAFEEGIDVDTIIDTMSGAMNVVGEKFSAGEYFITEMLLGAHAFKAGFDILKPALEEKVKKSGDTKKKGVVVLGTVINDIHDIGKNMVGSALQAAGYEIHDIGIDQPLENFITKAEEVDANIIALSALLTTTMDETKNLIELLKERGLNKKYKVLIGGAPMSQKFSDSIGADAYAIDAFDAVEQVKKLMETIEG
jgi:methylmalonyl-CoA mutase cobalamin-binding domain/chain|tara:strand:+ start:4447 stop:5109 length:663 start_codon:yes stop_codon:yes gene_type:complete